ncbi:MAG: hypothetical protein H8E13_17480 [Actinobacteria bacterium]|nr:hypothetical protein [Actinomycetota bacterium]
MKYSKGVVENDVLKIKETKYIDQDDLVSDCWLIQFDGLNTCENCELKGTDECGGGETLKKLLKKNKEK